LTWAHHDSARGHGARIFFRPSPSLLLLLLAPARASGNVITVDEQTAFSEKLKKQRQDDERETVPGTLTVARVEEFQVL